MSARLLHDLRYQHAATDLRGLYLQLYLRRAELPALAQHAPEAVAATVLGCSSDEAAEHLAALRRAGLVGDGLTLLVGAGRARAQAVPAATQSEVEAHADTDDLRDRARASGRSVSDLAREAGLDRSALSKYLATGSGLGADRRARLAAVVGCAAGVQSIPCETQGVQSPVQSHVQLHTTDAQHTSPAPSPSLVSPSSPLALPSDSPSEPSQIPTPTAGSAREAGLTLSAQETPTRTEKAAAKAAARAERVAAQEKARAEKAAAKAALVALDPVPLAGTPARAIYDAITGDARLGPITEGPGEFAQRAAQPALYPGVNVLAEVLAAGEWLSRQRVGSHSKGRAFLAHWLKRATTDAASAPRPAPGVVRTSAAFAAPAPRGKAPLATREDFLRDAATPEDLSIYGATGT